MGGNVGCCSTAKLDHHLTETARYTQLKSNTDPNQQNTKTKTKQNQNATFQQKKVVAKTNNNNNDPNDDNKMDCNENNDVDNKSKPVPLSAQATRRSIKLSHRNTIIDNKFDKYMKSQKKHHSSRHHHHRKKDKNKDKKDKKSKKDRKSSFSKTLKECIKEFNKSMTPSVTDLFGNNPINSVSSEYNQSELLDYSDIYDYFKSKKEYNIEWFLLLNRNEFIKIIVNQWNNISILTSIKLYDMLKEKLIATNSSIGKSSLELFKKNTLTQQQINRIKSTTSASTRMSDIQFVWQSNINSFKELNDEHLLYIISLVIKQLNQEKKYERSLAKSSNNIMKPLYHQQDILTYLYEIKMNGYLMISINANIFYLNISKIIIDSNIKLYSKEYSLKLYNKIVNYDFKIHKKYSNYTIQFSQKNSERFESVTQLIKSMDSALNLVSDDGDDNGDYETSDDYDDDDDDDDDVKSVSKSPDIILANTKKVYESIELLRKKKDNMDPKEYLKEMEKLQQQLKLIIQGE